MQAKPTKAETAEHLIGEPLGPWVVRHREDDRSWQWIADRIGKETGGQVTVSDEYLRRLFGEAAA
jgi:hypothetical protein